MTDPDVGTLTFIYMSQNAKTGSLSCEHLWTCDGFTTVHNYQPQSGCSSYALQL